MAVADLAPELGGEVQHHLRLLLAQGLTRDSWLASARPGTRCTLTVGRRYDYRTCAYTPEVTLDLKDAGGRAATTVLSAAEAEVVPLTAITSDDILDAHLAGERSRTADDLVRALGGDPAAVLPPEERNGGRLAE